MKLNTQIIFLIAIIGIITAGVVGASVLNNGSMKQVEFDGIKLNVPSDAEFINTGNGFVDSKYGISIHTFKDNSSSINYLNGVKGASVVSLQNQPPQSVAFKQGEDTNIFLTNGAEGISIGAKDQNLVTKMSNSVVFSNHQKSVKPSIPVPGIAPPHLSLENDYNLILAFIGKINNKEVFNIDAYELNVNQSIQEYNNLADNGINPNEINDQQSVGDSNVSGNPGSSSLMDNSQVSDVVNSIGGGDNSQPVASSGGDSNLDSSSVAEPSSSPASSDSVSSSSPAASSGSSSSSSGGDQSNTPEKLSKQDVKSLVRESLPSGYSIKSISDKGSYYLVVIKDSSGSTEDLKIDAYTGQQI